MDRPAEAVDRIEPCHLTEPPIAITDTVAELAAAATRLGDKLHPNTAASLADLVRIMNTYYSNLIEGHHTRPRDIERALAEDLEADPARRNLQIEARAHLRVQAEIDGMAAAGCLPDPASVSFIRWLHETFYQGVPDEILLIKGAHRTVQMRPGFFRDGMGEDVAVGRHLPPTSARVPGFMAYFEQRYSFETLTRQGSRIIAMAAAHHRLAYIHPFPDGNGRVTRLMSHAMGLKAGIGAHGLWSVSRGLARGLKSRTEYKSKLDYADTPRRGDLDGRGNLSLTALKDFVQWFLDVCLDQVAYMGGLFALDSLSDRLRRYVGDHPAWKPEAFHILNELLLRGEMQRGETARVTGLPERTARTILVDLLQDGIIASTTPKSPVSLRFPAAAAERLFPDLYPET